MQTINIKHVDGTVSSAAVTPTVQVAFERHFKVGISAMADASTLRMEYIYWLAWQATTAGRKNRPAFDDWLVTVAEIEQDDDEATATADDDEEAPVSPLDTTPPPGGSLPSPSSLGLG
jgi:hypothetical protein